MKTPLAVLVPRIGMRSETFARRHMCDLLPGQTASIGRLDPTIGAAPDWTPRDPVLDLGSGLAGGDELRWRAARALARKASVQPEFLAVARFVRRHEVEVLLVDYLHTASRWLPVARRLGIRFFAHAHGVDASAYLRERRWREAYRSLNEADGVVALSDIMRQRLISIGIAPEKLSIIRCGVDVPEEPPPQADRAVVRCLAVGRMVPKKAPILLLDAFRRAAEEVPNLTLDYVGDGPLAPAARQFVSAMRLDHRVTLHGGLHHAAVARLMADADIFIQHSVEDPETGDAEGLPRAVLEAMAGARPVVSTRHEGIVDAIPDETFGLLVEEGDTTGMAAGIAELARDPDQRSRIGQAAWKRARDHFTWERERTQLLSLLGLATVHDRAGGDIQFEEDRR